MTSLDPSHLPTRAGHDPRSRGQAVQYNTIGTHDGRHKVTLPIPDLRFEQSYLRSLKRYVHFSEAAKSSSETGGVAAFKDEKKGKVELGGEVARVEEANLYGVPMRIEWGWVVYITARDQVLSPFIQGAALLAATAYLRPFLRSIGSYVRSSISNTLHQIFPPLTPHVKRGVQWAGNQFKDMSVSGVQANLALAK
ncbi:hypothetical protein M422DRAFT_262478 [Sphaerobolus stellatus SS14]|uniref:Uncharacterized protein n=1 Tax=Sphaerobolus stellatus (strain SS14) TaxID=990650 RepID=A0A0C9V124_SPHS4|nr:hypothetical protein M422DRAFT_262478 [Sphaerobolus stellatus SS14]